MSGLGRNLLISCSASRGFGVNINARRAERNIYQLPSDGNVFSQGSVLPAYLPIIISVSAAGTTPSFTASIFRKMESALSSLLRRLSIQTAPSSKSL